MIGMTWGVEWCVVGLDRNWAYNPALQDGAALTACRRYRFRSILFLKCSHSLRYGLLEPLS